MKKKGFIVIAIVAVLILVVLAVVLGKGKDTEVSNEGPTAVPTLVPEDESTNVTEIPEPTKGVDEEIIPTAPIVGDDNNEDKPNKDDAIDFPNDDVEPTKAPSLVTPRPNVTLEPTKAPQISEAPKASPTPIVEATKTPTPSVTPTPTSTPIPTQKVEITPTVAPTSTPKPTSTPTPTKAPSANGKVELESIGISVPKRDEFNEVALKKDKAWWGDVDDTKSGQALGDTLDSIFYALEAKGVAYSGTQAFLLQDNIISWDWASYSGSHDFSLVRDTTNGEYVLEINCPLDKDEFFGRDLAPYNKDIVKVLVSCFSSEVEDVYFEVFDSIYGDNDISIPMYPSWATIGDCQASFDYEASYNNHFVFKFKSN